MVCMMIVPESMAETANQYAASIDPESMGEAFTKRLRLIGSVESTHRYGGPNLVDENVIAAIRQLAQSTEFAGGIYHECSPENVRAEFEALLAEHGLEEIPAPEDPN